MAGTDDRTIKFTPTTEKVGEYVKFTINGETVVGNVAVVNGANSYATVVL